MGKILKIIGVALVLVLGVLAVSYLQYRFDRSDIQHAVDAVRMTRPQGPRGKTLEQVLSERHGVPVERIFWRPEFESKLKGTVRVKAQLPENSEHLEWQVDLVRFQVMPLTPAARALGQAHPASP